MTTLFLQNYPRGYILPYYKSPRTLSLSPECLLNFLSNFYIPPCVRKIFKFMEFTFLENALIRGIASHAPSHSKLPPKYLPSRPRQKEITHSPRQHFVKNLLLPTAERVEKTMIGYIKIHSKNIKLIWNIRFFIFCTICNFFRCDGFTVL